MSPEKKHDSWRPEEYPMTPSSDEDDEGLIESPGIEEDSENSQMANPAKLDFKTWKNIVNGLIRSENHVLMENDDKLRAAINRAMFLETASENLLEKRKRQIDMLDEFRGVEGAAAKKLFVDVKPILQRELGAGYDELEKNFTKSFTKSSQPLWLPPDISRPPPQQTAVVFPLPPMHVPPPAAATTIVKPTMPANFVPPFLIEPPFIAQHTVRPFQTTPTRPAPVSLMSQHLLPPSIVDFSRSDNVENEEKKHEKSVSPKPASSDSRSTSWRRPYHPTPIPPPSPFVSPLSQPPRPPPFVRSARRRSFGTAERGNLSPPGLVGVNVHGLFVGDRRLSSAAPLRNSTRNSSSRR